MDINNKVAVITGGTGGIGVAIVKQLLENKIKCIALFDLDNANTRTTFTNLKKDYGERVEFYSCDVTNGTQFTENFDKVLKIHKTIDILLNNAGIAGDSRIELMIELNYKAVVLGTLLFIERLGKHKGGYGGVVVNTASVAGLKNFSFVPVYSSTKHAVVSFTQSLDEQYDVTGVRVLVICPGLTDTPLISDIFLKTLDFVNNTDSELKKFTLQPPEFVAHAVVKIIEEGKSGEVWVAENSEPPYAVKGVGNFEQLRVPID